MNALPTIDPPVDGETLQGYGVRVLAFVLETGVTATLSDHDLELADHVYPIAVSNHDMSVTAIDRLTGARHLILAALKTRRAFDAIRQAACETVPPKSGGQPGKGALLQPQPISRPPAGAVVKPDIRF